MCYALSVSRVPVRQNHLTTPNFGVKNNHLSRTCSCFRVPLSAILLLFSGYLFLVMGLTSFVYFNFDAASGTVPVNPSCPRIRSKCRTLGGRVKFLLPRGQQVQHLSLTLGKQVEGISMSKCWPNIYSMTRQWSPMSSLTLGESIVVGGMRK